MTQLSFLINELQITKLYLRSIFRVKGIRIDRNFVSSARLMFEFVSSLYTKMNSSNSRLTFMFMVATEISVFRPHTGHGTRYVMYFFSFA